MHSPGHYAIALDALYQFREKHGGTLTDGLNETTWRSEVTVGALNLDGLERFVQAGHQGVIEIRKEGWRARLTGKGAEVFDFDVSGPWEDAFADPQDAEEVQEAVQQRDLGRFLSGIREFSGVATLTLLNDPSETGTHWIRTETALVNLFKDSAWLPLTNALVGGPAAEVVIQDAGDQFVQTESLLVRGHEAPSLAQASIEPLLDAYREAWLPDLYRDLAAPTTFSVRDRRGLDRITDRFESLAAQLVWAWLADAIRIESAAVIARFEGVRSVDIALEDPLGPLPSLLETWRWATASSDPARREAVQQAVTLAIRDQADVPTAPLPVLRTARYLYRTSQQRLVGEALAARRGARDAAVAAGRTAAETARTVARKTFDRVAVQIAAAVGVLIANKQALVDQQTAQLITGAILLLLMLMFVTSLAFEYPAARAELDAAHADLEAYRETLPQEEIDEIQQSKSALDAIRQIERSRDWTALLATGAMLLVAAASSALEPISA